jgi:hypothetical protein
MCCWVTSHCITVHGPVLICHYASGTWLLISAWVHIPVKSMAPINVLNPNVHGVMRRKVSSAFIMSTLVSYEPYVYECIAILEMLEQSFCKVSLKHGSIDLSKWLRCYAFDVIGMITEGLQELFHDQNADSAQFSHLCTVWFSSTRATTNLGL